MPKSFRRFVLYGIFIALFSIAFVQPSFARPPTQNGDQGVNIVTDSQTGLYQFVGVNSAATGSALPGAAALQQGGTPSAATALADLTTYGKQFGLSDPGQELQFMKASSNPGIGQSFRYQQVYQGVPVIAGELIANYDANGRLVAVVGEASAKLALSTTPRVTTDRATTIALEYVAKREGVAVSDLTASPTTLSIFDPYLFTSDNDAPSLVWRLEVRPAADLKPIRYMVLVDAVFGAVALAFNQIDTAWHSSQPAQKTQAAHPAVAAQAALPIFAAPQFAPHFANPAGATYDSHGSTAINYPPYRICNTVPTTLTDATSCGGFPGSGVTAASAAHFFAYNTFNYYDVHHNRNSINGAGLALISNVNYCQSDPINGVFCPGGYENAFWDGVEMVYGDSGWWTADDVIGHELSHGVTEHESGLFYFYESGAINESMSDIFGEFVDQWNGINSFNGGDAPGDKWQLGEDLTNGALRSMSDPTNAPGIGNIDQPDRTQSTLYWQDTLDNGGVHINSGVGNKAAYLMAQGGSFNGYTISALGNDKTSAIFYEVNSNLLTSGADYGVLGAAIVQACTNVLTGVNAVGMTAADCAEAREATLATEMQLDPVNAVIFRPQAEVCPNNGSRVSVSLLNANFESGLAGFTPGIITGGGALPASVAWTDTNNAFGSPYAISGTHSVFGVNAPEAYGLFVPGGYASYLQMAAPVALPANSIFYLHFNHAFAFEPDGFDGAVLQYSKDGGGWLDAAPLYEAGQDYNGVIDSTYNNPLGDTPAFVEQSHGYVSTRYNLSSLAGHSVRFRWVIGADTSVFVRGWFLDDIQIYTCDILRNYTVDTTPTLTWTGTSWATSYDVAIAKNSTFTAPSVDIYITGSNATTFVPPVELPPGTYYWRVRANNGATLGTWGPSDSFTVGS